MLNMRNVCCWWSFFLLHQIALFGDLAESFAPFTVTLRRRSDATHLFMAAGKGFGKPPSASGPGPSKTYGQDARPSRDVIDMESSMNAFFSSREDWLPLFRSLAIDDSCPAFDFLGHLTSDIEFHEDSSPWRRLQAAPDAEEDRTVLASFLDEAQAALLQIPTDEKSEEDDFDLQFVEEGRRILALNRFHVLRDNHGVSVENVDALFSTCWNEVMHLNTQEEEHTGSLIILPQYTSLSDLRRFTDMNVLQPLEWLGLGNDFEVSSFQRGSPAIRLIYKLSGIPDPSEREAEDE